MERAEQVEQILAAADGLLAELNETVVEACPDDMLDTVIEPFDPPFDPDGEPDTLTDTEIATAVVDLPPLVLDDLDDLLESLPTAPTPAFRSPPPRLAPVDTAGFFPVAPHIMRPLTVARPSRFRSIVDAVTAWFRGG